MSRWGNSANNDREDDKWSVIVERICAQRDASLEETRATLASVGREGPVPVHVMRKLLGVMGLHLFSGPVAEALARALAASVPADAEGRLEDDDTEPGAEWSSLRGDLAQAARAGPAPVVKPLVLSLCCAPEWFWSRADRLAALAVHWDHWWRDLDAVQAVVDSLSLNARDINPTDASLLRLLEASATGEGVEGSSIGNFALLAQAFWPETVGWLASLDASALPRSVRVLVDVLACRSPPCAGTPALLYKDAMQDLARTARLRVRVSASKFAVKCLAEHADGPALWRSVLLSADGNAGRCEILKHMLLADNVMDEKRLAALEGLETSSGGALNEIFAVLLSYFDATPPVGPALWPAWGAFMHRLWPKNSIAAFETRMQLPARADERLDVTRAVLVNIVHQDTNDLAQVLSWAHAWAPQVRQRPGACTSHVFATLTSHLDETHRQLLHERVVVPLACELGLLALDKPGQVEMLLPDAVGEAARESLRAVWRLFVASALRTRNEIPVIRSESNAARVKSEQGAKALSGWRLELLLAANELYPCDAFANDASRSRAVTWLRHVADAMGEARAEAASLDCQPVAEAVSAGVLIAGWLALSKSENHGSRAQSRVLRVLCRALQDRMRKGVALENAEVGALLVNAFVSRVVRTTCLECECPACESTLREEQRLLVVAFSLLRVDRFEEAVQESVDLSTLIIPNIFGLFFARTELAFRRSMGFETLTSLIVLSAVVNSDAELRAATKVASACFRTTSIMGVLDRDLAIESCLVGLVGEIDPAQAQVWGAVLRDGASDAPVGTLVPLTRIACMALSAPFLLCELPQETECTLSAAIARTRAMARGLLKASHARSASASSSSASLSEALMLGVLGCVVIVDTLRAAQWANSSSLAPVASEALEALRGMDTRFASLSSAITAEARGLLVRVAEMGSVVLRAADGSQRPDVAALQDSGLLVKLTRPSMT